MSERDLQRWSREVAEDPGAPSFVRLARAYRRRGQRDAARDVVVRGLERSPEHVEAHSLLALLHVEEGDRQSARDEWETVLALEPGHFDASRGLGFLALERNDLHAARRHLDAALLARPDDPTVAQARQLVDRRAAAGPARSRATPTTAPATAPARTGEPTPAARAPTAVDGPDPIRLFEPLRAEGPFLGAIVLDDQGLVLAGGLEDDAGGTTDLLGGLLNGVVGEAQRTVELVRMGGWESLMVECDQATLHLTPLGGGTLVVATPPRTPAGWVVRVAALARKLAHRFVETEP